MEIINIPSLIVIAVILIIVIAIIVFLQKRGGSCPQKTCQKYRKAEKSSCVTGQMKEFSPGAIECQACSPPVRKKCQRK
ncbi:MAG: hypothetical protein HUJ51_04290 [Eggerthellaceae bacterium]|nr:hypothetical protein [Eggerthellaceae bacterium]